MLGFFLVLLIHVDDLFAIIVPALLANRVGELQLVALGALHQGGGRQIVVRGTTGISPCLGRFSLRYCHDYTSLSSKLNAFSASKALFLVFSAQLHR